MSFVRKSISPRAGVGTEITPAKMLDDYYGFNRLLELVQGGMGDSLWDAGDTHVLSGKKYGKTGGVTGVGTGAITVTLETIGSGPTGQFETTHKSYVVAAGVTHTSAVSISAACTEDTRAIYCYVKVDAVQKASASVSGGGFTLCLCGWGGEVSEKQTVKCDNAASGGKPHGSWGAIFSIKFA